MLPNVETILSYFSQIRRVYAPEIHLRFKDENFSPNEISILILLSNNASINTSSQLTLILGVSKGLVSRSIDSLLSRGLIVCLPDMKDKRLQRIKWRIPC
ncbi:MAG: MarR family transcriptional regulator [Firmicutes bacterium]|uniref:MarR family transcriptional regulator n=1 Tax=Candidatus Scybalomonas excrementavium TaxID=2840943 RepID=A0A9D9N731_9FIRM|nr:MarR family transcriptional regulator [Candidatus Scybalomonas excrementavium]